MISNQDFLGKLTDRQREVLTLLAERLSNNDVTLLLELAEAKKLDMTRICNLLHWPSPRAAPNKHKDPVNAD
jgi:ATP/maltotriose-dependent transcriptional regulator MalT